MSIDSLIQGRSGSSRANGADAGDGSNGANGQNGMPVRSATGGMRGAVSVVHTGG
ncbi:hypothetical protein [Pectobacterium versatile]|uniref:hypothetical protein n=1 Tax=Pectobacterium versatile TaxID=2488639 RepID=UPI001CCD1F1B|nr:hypothetical protein [Pectobacterium versatile]